MVVTNHILKPRRCRWTMVLELSLDRIAKVVEVQDWWQPGCQLPFTVNSPRAPPALLSLHLSPDKAIPALHDPHLANAHHKSEEADERAVTRRIHEFFVHIQKATDAKREGEAKAWT